MENGGKTESSRVASPERVPIQDADWSLHNSQIPSGIFSDSVQIKT